MWRLSELASIFARKLVELPPLGVFTMHCTPLPRYSYAQPSLSRRCPWQLGRRPAATLGAATGSRCSRQQAADTAASRRQAAELNDSSPLPASTHLSLRAWPRAVAATLAAASCATSSCSLRRRRPSSSTIVLFTCPGQAKGVFDSLDELIGSVSVLTVRRVSLRLPPPALPNPRAPTSAAAAPILPRAASTTATSSPSRSAMLSALLRPGMPHSNLQTATPSQWSACRSADQVQNHGRPQDGDSWSQACQSCQLSVKHAAGPVKPVGGC